MSVFYVAKIRMISEIGKQKKYVMGHIMDRSAKKSTELYLGSKEIDGSENSIRA